MTARSGLRVFLRSGAGGVLTAAVFVSFLPAPALAQDQPEASAPSGGASSSEDTSGLDLATTPLPTFGGNIDLAEGYTTNAQGYALTPSNKDDTFTRGRLGLFLNYKRPRIDLHGAYLLTGQYYGRQHQADHLSNRLNLTSRTTVVPEMLFVTANAFAAPGELTRVGAISASGEPVSNYNTRDTYGYFVQPQLLLRFNDFAVSSTTVSQSGVFFVQPSTADSGTVPPVVPPKNSLTTAVTETLASGTNFDRLQWEIVGSYAESAQTVRSQKQAQAAGRLSYALTRSFRIFGVGGYSDYRTSTVLAKSIGGPFGLGGITYKEADDFALTLEAGIQNNFPTYMGSLRWNITPRTAIVADATDTVGTPQNGILGRLAGVSYASDGSFNDTGVGLGVGPINGYSPVGSGNLALDNSLYRMRSIRASFLHTDDRMQYTLTLYGDERDRLDVAPGTSPLPRTSVYGVRARVSRQLNARMSAYVSGAYSFSNEFSGHDHIVTATGRLNYRLTESWNLYLSDFFVQRDNRHQTGVPNVPLTEDQVLLGIQYSF